ncbi:hypothetical protein [Burkholderia arboris]|uniref:hypothetical protein n=1 Tax=Burkholderia arboris TaxID=488730 RepID=UPI0030F2A621
MKACESSQCRLITSGARYSEAWNGIAARIDLPRAGIRLAHIASSRRTVGGARDCCVAAIAGRHALVGRRRPNALIRVLRPWCKPFACFYVYAPTRTQMPAKVRAIIDFLVEKREAVAASRVRASALPDR